MTAQKFTWLVPEKNNRSSAIENAEQFVPTQRVKYLKERLYFHSEKMNVYLGKKWAESGQTPQTWRNLLDFTIQHIGALDPSLARVGGAGAGAAGHFQAHPRDSPCEWDF